MKIALVVLFIITFAYSQYLGIQLSKAEGLLQSTVRMTYSETKDLPEPGTPAYNLETPQGFVRGHNHALHKIRHHIHQNSDRDARFFRRQPDSTATEDRKPVGK